MIGAIIVIGMYLAGYTFWTYMNFLDHYGGPNRTFKNFAKFWFNGVVFIVKYVIPILLVLTFLAQFGEIW